MTAKEKEQVESMVKKDDAPSYLSRPSGQARGLEDADQSDLIMPRLGLCQALSPQKKKSDPAYIEGLEEAQFFNTVTGTIYGSKVTLIPIVFLKQRIKFFPIDDGGGIDCISLNGKTEGRLHPESCQTCPHSQFLDGNHPECSLFHNRLSFIPAAGDLLVTSFKSTGLKESRQWVALVKLTGKDLFARAYELEVKEIKKGQYSWWGAKVRPRQWVTAEEFKQMESLYETFKGKEIKVDVRDMASEIQAEESSEFRTAEM